MPDPIPPLPSRPLSIPPLPSPSSFTPPPHMPNPIPPSDAPPPSPPTPALSQLASPPATPKPHRASADLAPGQTTPQAPHYPAHSKALSLSSTRRAPPSPSMSRRTSEASKRYSSVSAASSRHRSSLLTSTVVGSASPAKPPHIKVKDFAFPAHDDRHLGKGPDAPRPNRQNSRLSTASSSSSTSGTRSRRNSGWSAFKWASAGSRLWNFGFGKGSITADYDDDSSRPTQSDFERNFDISSPTEPDNPQIGSPESYLDDDSEDYSSDQEFSDAEPLLPGLYRAMYAFSPEGDSEMALEEGQVVRVIGRGGGVGWAVALRDGSDKSNKEGKHALVPESYLELVKLDEGDGAD